ncbi:short-chain fatty acyl-CoA regulator family protein [Fulvimarina sp. 2208YS6-2-32]|uniref:Short-chain fatty acyl-CoA regulator family protein n=1 Tax=Fulvimarina uroteuthidis TaxID=3098149 RepID=A0ABU5I322_9HYPH|nr:short-chain fatty acyl-CoA regulator family protein [Fulvimarina sp. 2208YS6-2-32]MDY8108576.1 short-chain fatty acyl-CoA regulator family protein [Fulvimarina sp. 2208YS6-2-32]
MADNKIFAGPRIRRMRHGLSLTQTAMAEELGISPSYLNLIERNQRPLTAPLVARLLDTYDIDLGDLGGSEDKTLSGLKALFSDPLLTGEIADDRELADLVDAAPNAAKGVLKLYRAYREQQGRLTDLSTLLAKSGRTTSVAGTRLPIDEVHDIFEGRPNFFAPIDSAAEAFHKELFPESGKDANGVLRTWLRAEREVAVQTLPVQTMPNYRRRFDRHSRRLFLSERLSHADRLREIALQACMLKFGEIIDREWRTFTFTTDEAGRLARFELLRYAAHALLMPYGAFQRTAVAEAYDLDVLAARFQVSFEQAANRLTTLQRQGAPGLPFFMLEIDNAGNHFRRAGARGFPVQRFGGECPKLPVHAAFAQPGHIIVEAAETPDGTQFLLVARTLEGLQTGFEERPRRTAILIGCDIGFKDETVYGRQLRTDRREPGRTGFTKIGTACRLCERQACLARAEPPLTRPSGFDEMVTGLSAFDFQ